MGKEESPRGLEAPFRGSQWWRIITSPDTAKPIEARSTLLAKHQDMDTHLRLIRPHQIVFSQERLGWSLGSISRLE
ncbi:hypothetical protein LA080_003032 [Diaporthe eres]|nr:hypothetical protein LA080_003032 [Diaporthe eres]